MISPKEHPEAYQAALAWVTRQIEAAERQGLTVDYLGGWHTCKPNAKALELAWRVLYGIPDTMRMLLTSPDVQWALVILRWERHRHARG